MSSVAHGETKESCKRTFGKTPTSRRKMKDEDP